MPPKAAKSKEAPVERPILGRFSSHLKIGIVGLPNVGKSTLFNTLTKLSIPAENFPFCTIEPNEARVNIPDERFEWLCQLFKPKSEVSAFLEIHDIAGLVRGAHEGQGLGNSFLSHIRAVDGIFHVLRAFEDPDIIHVDDTVDPVRDLEIITAELRLKDIESIERRIEDLEKSMKRSNDKQLKVEHDLCLKVKTWLEEEKDVRLGDWKAAEIEILNTFQLLTAKPVVYLVNMNEKDYQRKKNKFLPKIHAWNVLDTRRYLHSNSSTVPWFVIKGYVIGNGFTDFLNDYAAKYPYAHRVALISDEYYEWAKSSCQGDYSRQDLSNTKCLFHLDLIDKCVEGVNRDDILVPKCLEGTKRGEFKHASQDMLFLPSQQAEQCKDELITQICVTWANDPGVQQALHIRKGTLASDWMRCNRSSSYLPDMRNVTEFHQIHTKKAYRVLVYSGDHDMTMPYVGSLAWIRKLNLNTVEHWRPWNVDNQVAGFTETYRGNTGFSLTFATVKGGQHVTGMNKPKESSAMIERWFSYRPL